MQITTVLVTHDQAEAIAIGTRVAVLSKGRVEQIGAPKELYEKPANPFVAEFVGTMNRLHAARRGDGITFGGDNVLFFRPHDILLVAPDKQEVLGSVAARFFAGNVTRFVIRLTDGQTVAVDATGQTSIAPGDRVGVVFQRQTTVGET